MSKRKIRIGSRKRKVSKPRSNDSGVSLKSTHKLNIDSEKNLVLNDSGTPDETDTNLKISAELEGTAEHIEETCSDQQLKPVSVLKKPQLAFIEDENFLDYEPSEDEVDVNSSAANYENCTTNNCEEPKTNNNDYTKLLISSSPVNIQGISDCKLSNRIGSIAMVPDLSCSSADSDIVGEACTNHDENMVNECNLSTGHPEIEDESSEKSFDTKGETVFYGENQLLSEKNGQTPTKNLFENAKVHFNGPLNITITRPVINNAQSQIPGRTFNDAVQNLNVPSVALNEKVEILDMSTLTPEKNVDTEKHFEKKKWPDTVNHNIVNHDVDNISVFQEIHSKLAGEEDINSEHTRSFVSDVLLNRGEYELQENDREEFVARWLMHNNEDYFSELLNSLCESHFTAGCSNLRCSKTHTMEEIKKMIHQSNLQELGEYYRITLKKDLWFTWLFDIFLDCFTVMPNGGEMMLIDMINDVYKAFNSILTDKTPFIVKIIQRLRRIGLSFKQAIKRIIMRYGTTQLWICDILLFIIAAEPNLDDHWCLVQRLTCCRKEKIDHKVVKELLMASLNNNSQNEEFGKRIYQDIFEKNLVDMTKIPGHLRALIVNMAGNQMELQRSVVTSDLDSEKSNSQELFCPINPTVRNSQRERFSLNESSLPNLQDQMKVMSGNLSDKEGDIFFDETMRQDVFSTRKRYLQKKRSRKSGSHKSWTPSTVSSPKMVNNRVLRNIIKSLNIIPEPQTPANIIAHPSFQRTIDSLYLCNISLHNLLPEVHYSLTDITIVDLRRLKNALKQEDAVEFLNLLQSYSDPNIIENFLINVLTLLKSVGKSSVAYSTFMSLLNSLEKMDCSYMNETYVKVSLQVLALNLIYMFNVKGRCNLSRNILFKMKDWHNLVTSKILLTKSHLSHMGRYIYIINVLIQAKEFSWANEIFQSEVLKLLGPTSSWPYQYKPSDTQDRNQVLGSLLDICFPQNIFITNDLLKHIANVYSGSVDGFDVWSWFNRKILSLMEEGSNESVLLLLYNDISNYYEKYMDKYVLQAYMLHMVNCISSDMALKLFKICCNKGIYHKYTGEEQVVYVTTNLTDFEITSLLQCYFENFRTGRFSPHNFSIDLIPPEKGLVEFSISEKCRINRNVYKVFERICNILDSKFQIRIDQPVQSTIFISRTNQQQLLIFN